MVPFACHVNHSPWPHVVRYGKLQSKTQTLDFPAFRPCKRNQQVFISYGPVPNLKLISYYGFCIPDNPHDVVPITIQPPATAWNETKQGIMSAMGIGFDHNLRDGALSPSLLACLRLIVSTDEELKGSIATKKVDILAEKVSPACELQALRCLDNAVQQLLGSVDAALGNMKRYDEGDHDATRSSSRKSRDEISPDGVKLNENGLDENWHASVQFCRTYLIGQRKILERSANECEERRHNVSS